MAQSHFISHASGRLQQWKGNLRKIVEEIEPTVHRAYMQCNSPLGEWTKFIMMMMMMIKQITGIYFNAFPELSLTDLCDWPE